MTLVERSRGLLAIVGLAAVVIVAIVISRRGRGGRPRRDVVVADGAKLASTANAEEKHLIESVLAAGGDDRDLATLKIDYPLDGSIFPPEMIAPTFLWHDPATEADQWVIDVALADGADHIYVLAAGDPPPKGEIDLRCLGDTNEVYQPSVYQASAKSWTPDPRVWAAIKAGSSSQPAVVTMLGFRADRPGVVLSRGRMTLTTSADPVGAPIFYRDVPLMPAPTGKGIIKPLPNGALPLIAWRLREVSRPDSRVVLTDMPTCGNCHSFSDDGTTFGMDIDGPSGDKGAYALAPVAPHIVIEAKDIISWNSFPDKPEDHKTIGFLSRVSPDGQHVVTTVNESVYVANFLDYRFLQVFYPTRGILAYYSRRTGEMKALPGAGDTNYVHCDPVWTPDGRWIVFARAEAKDPYEEGRGMPARANDPAELPVQYDLYRMPFNQGRGGRPEAIAGASQNGMSNTFPKVSPDGKWMVFVKCRNGQLMRPDSELWIVPTEGGKARRMTCNTSLMNSWHSFSPNGRWLVFSSKSNTPYTQMFLTHLDENGDDSPAILIPEATAANRAVNLPEFVKIGYDDLVSIRTPTVEYYRYYERGNEHMHAGRLRQAIAEFRRALEAEPTAARINSNIGMCLMGLGQVDESIPYFTQALETTPRNWIVRTNLAAALIRRRQLDQALDHLRKAIEYEPKYPWAHFNLGYALAMQGKLDEAVKHFKRTVEIAPQAGRARLELGRALAQQGDLEASVKQLEEAIRLLPGSADCHHSLGVVLQKQGRRGEAIGQFREALRINPHHSDARQRLRHLTEPERRKN